jgi:hypothetical protein
VTREENWPSVLAAALEAARARPFEWGQHDCVMFALDTVRAMTGADLARPFRGRYASLKGALAYLASHGGALSAMLDATFDTAGLAEVHPNFAQRGDLAFVLNSGEAVERAGLAQPFDGALGLVVGATIAVVPSAGGLAHAARDAMARAWTI